MAFSHKVVRVTAFGTMFNATEEWSTGFYMGAVGADAAATDQDFLEAIAGDWGTFFNAATSGIGWAWHTTGMKMATLNTDGSTDIDSVKTYYYPAAFAGGNQVTGFPAQIATVATLVAGTARGLGHLGRMYIPGVCHAIMGTGKMADASAQSVSLNLKTFFDAVNAEFNSPGQIINASKGRVSPAAAGINREITELRVGTVYDTQRRRRNQLQEAYSIRTLA